MSEDFVPVEIVCLQVPVFCIGDDKEGAIKPLEEASEALEKWKQWRAADNLDEDDTLSWMAESLREDLEDEIFDTIQASVNFAARNGLNLHDAAKRVTMKNVARERLPLSSQIYAMVRTPDGGLEDVDDKAD